MKKMYFIAISAIALFAVVLISCYKSTLIPNADDSGSVVVFERSASTSNNGSFFSDHLIKTEKLMKNNPLIKDLKNDPDWTNAQLNDEHYISYDKVLLHSYNNSAIKVMEIPIYVQDEGEQFWMIFVYEKKYIITKYTVSSTKDGNTKAVLASSDDSIFFELVTSAENRIQSYNFDRQIPFNKILRKNISKRSVAVQESEDGSTCPERYPNSFTDCFQCAVSECSNDALCAIACGLYAPSCVIGFTIACA
jgi:hypothetical protein